MKGLQRDKQPLRKAHRLQSAGASAAFELLWQFEMNGEMLLKCSVQFGCQLLQYLD